MLDHFGKSPAAVRAIVPHEQHQRTDRGETTKKNAPNAGAVATHLVQPKGVALRINEPKRRRASPLRLLYGVFRLCARTASQLPPLFHIHLV